MTPSEDTTLWLKHLYHAYRHTTELEGKGIYFSPTCMQICRPTPSYAATTREQIVQYLRDAQQGNVPVTDPSGPRTRADISDEGVMRNSSQISRSVYTIRPILPSEHEFGTEQNIAPIQLNSESLQRMVKEEQWVGMRVDLWDEGPEDAGLLVKVQYWWRLERIRNGEGLGGDTEDYGWRQCMHDIMYLGPRDGTEYQTRLEILE